MEIVMFILLVIGVLVTMDQIEKLEKRCRRLEKALLWSHTPACQILTRECRVIEAAWQMGLSPREATERLVPEQ